MTFDLGILLGLIAIAVAIYFGLWGFRKDTGDKLSDIRDKVVAMGLTLDNAWALLKMHFLGQTGTVERNLRNLGKTKITAKPGEKTTEYTVDVEKAVLEQGLIGKLSKTTGLEDIEKKFFGDQIPTGITPVPTRVIVTLPCSDSQKCTEYMSTFLKWLDSTYYDLLPKIKDYEEPIQI